MKLALIQPPVLQPWELGEIPRVRELLAADREPPGFELVADASQADLVVLLESCSFKTQRDLPQYRALVRAHGAHRLVCINYEDGPPGFLPGLYSSIEAHRYEPALHRSWPHLKLPNKHADARAAQPDDGDRPHLFVFSGACSHPLRRRLFDAFEHRAGSHRVREIKRWYDHSEAELQQYVVDIAKSKFVLCPRGLASYSHRILETMALGRVPVVIADDWVPFSIPEADYYLRVPERQIEDIDRLLEAAEADHARLSSRVATVYAKYFEPRVRYTVALRQLVELHRACAGRLDARALEERWGSRAFWKANGWCLEQRVARKLRKLVAA